MLNGFRRAAISLAYDNGAVDRYQSEDMALANVDEMLAIYGTPLDPAINTYLEGLTDEEIEVVCNGEESIVAAMIAKAPPGTDELLNAIFNVL